MERGLMAKEDWDKLGFKEEDAAGAKNVQTSTS
jgi:hypothetical protein